MSENKKIIDAIEQILVISENKEKEGLVKFDAALDAAIAAIDNLSNVETELSSHAEMTIHGLVSAAVELRSHTRTCEQCGVFDPERSAGSVVDDTVVCDNCVYICDDCGGRFLRYQITELEGNELCTKCYDWIDKVATWDDLNPPMPRSVPKRFLHKGKF